ncbi:MAG: hypothetical protein AB7S71_08175 [Dongiaceae bacterium]
MSEAFTIYMDESGFTGEYLMAADQPIFVHASTALSNERCKELHTEFFRDNQAPELKHGVIARRPAGRDRIVRFIQAIHEHDRSAFTTWVVHKEFMMLTKLVDLWTEYAAYRDGVDLYKDGAHLALSNMAYFCLRTFESPEFLHGHLVRFQNMMMKRTPAAYREFWRHLYADFDRVDKRTRDILVFFLAGERLGFGHLVGLPERSVDPAMPGAVFTFGHWRRMTKLPLALVHDRSSSMAKDLELWKLVTSPAIDEMTLGVPDRELIYPLNVRTTALEDSRSFLQLQFCDLLAGASVAWARRFAGPNHDREYHDRLTAAGIEDFKIGTIWPELEVRPDELRTRGMTGEFIDTLAEQLRKVDAAKKSEL